MRRRVDRVVGEEMERGIVRVEDGDMVVDMVVGGEMEKQINMVKD